MPASTSLACFSKYSFVLCGQGGVQSVPTSERACERAALRQPARLQFLQVLVAVLHGGAQLLHHRRLAVLHVSAGVAGSALIREPWQTARSTPTHALPRPLYVFVLSGSGSSSLSVRRQRVRSCSRARPCTATWDTCSGRRTAHSSCTRERAPASACCSPPRTASEAPETASCQPAHQLTPWPCSKPDGRRHAQAVSTRWQLVAAYMQALYERSAVQVLRSVLRSSIKTQAGAAFLVSATCFSAGRACVSAATDRDGQTYSRNGEQCRRGRSAGQRHARAAAASLHRPQSSGGCSWRRGRRTAWRGAACCGAAAARYTPAGAAESYCVTSYDGSLTLLCCTARCHATSWKTSA